MTRDNGCADKVIVSEVTLKDGSKSMLRSVNIMSHDKGLVIVWEG